MKKIFCVPGFPAACISFAVWLYSCNDNDQKKFADKNTREGFILSQKYCKICHQLPDPLLLNKATWVNFVLPKMGELCGFRYLGQNHYVENGSTEIMKLEQWNKIVRYYTTLSPGEPVKGEPNSIKMGLRQFNIQSPSFAVRRPSTTMVNASSSKTGFFFGDGLTRQVYFISANNTVDSFPAQKGVSNLHVTDQAILALTMGVLQPSDSKEGRLLAVNTTTKNIVGLLDSLQRPVNATYCDLNDDNLEDIIVCEFGNITGQLGWFENKGGNKFVKHILRSLPGAVRTEIYDFNRDGLPDIMALMAQGDEGVFIYYNLGNNAFKEERILQLPSSYGSNYFELVDFNKDGNPDIIATNGDNGDYPPLLKPYHGIRIYLNDGNNNFKEKTFLPMNGACKAIAKDFDGDGDMDIASIAFFADFENAPEEGFIYWENIGNLSFEPSSSSGLTSGRWLTMDAGDIDGDDDFDIVLGNAVFFMEAMPDTIKKKLNTHSPSVLILKNILH